MRAAGFYRRGKGQYQSVQYFSNNAYFIDEIEAALNSTGKFPYGMSEGRFSRWKNEGDSVLSIPDDDLYPKLKPLKLYTSTFSFSEIPLEELLSRANRGALDGVHSNRNATGFALAKDLIGCADWLSTNGYKYCSDPYSLFISYCQRCSPGGGWNYREWDSIWRSAQRGTPKPSREESSLISAIHFWRWENELEYRASFKKQRLEPASDVYQKHLEWENEQDRIAEAQASEDFIQWLKANAHKLSKHSHQGFGQYQSQVQETDVSPPKLIRYNPGCPLPTPQNYQGRLAPKIQFKKGQRLEVLTQLKALGWPIVLDCSFMGLGKSHDAGLLKPDSEEISKVWYLDQNHRNPSTATVESNFIDLPVRHGGYQEDHSRRTPNGNPFLQPVEEGKIPDRPSSCHNYQLFNKLRDKGYNPNTLADGEMNPICSSCRARSFCPEKEGDGYGHKYARRAALQHQKIRAALDSLNNPDEYDYSLDIALVEEAGQSIRGTKTISGSWTDLLQQFDELEQHSPEAYETLKPLKNGLRSLLHGEIRQTHYGLDHRAILEVLGQPPESIEELIAVVRELQPNLSELVQKPDSVSGCSGEWKKLGNLTRSLMRREATQSTYENLEALPANLLIHILVIWAGEPGALRVDQERISATITDERHGNILRSFGFVILLDVTPNKRLLAERIGVDPNSIIEIEQELPALTNLEVVNVQMEGMGSGDWSK